MTDAAGLMSAAGSSEFFGKGVAFFLYGVRKYLQGRASIPTYGTQRCGDAGGVTREVSCSTSLIETVLSRIALCWGKCGRRLLGPWLAILSNSISFRRYSGCIRLIFAVWFVTDERDVEMKKESEERKARANRWHDEHPVKL